MSDLLEMLNTSNKSDLMEMLDTSKEEETNVFKRTMKCFDELIISTQTVIADTKIIMDIDQCFHNIPVEMSSLTSDPDRTTNLTTDHKSKEQQGDKGEDMDQVIDQGMKKKKTKFKKKKVLDVYPRNEVDDQIDRDMCENEKYRKNEMEMEEWVSLIPHVYCRAMYYKNDIKIDPKFPLKHRERYFRNALNVVLSLGNKCINFKLSKNGKFQLTGCKFLWHAQVSVVAFIGMIRKYCPNIAGIHQRVEALPITFQTVMTNVDFNTGFTINREKLDQLMNDTTSFYSLLETSFGYTGVNIKFPLPKEWWKVLEVPRVLIHWNDDTDKEYPVVEGCDKVVYDTVLQPSDRQRLGVKNKFNTFLVFHSGNVIMSGMSPQLMTPDYTSFCKLLEQWAPEIKEKIHSSSSTSSTSTSTKKTLSKKSKKVKSDQDSVK